MNTSTLIWNYAESALAFLMTNFQLKLKRAQQTLNPNTISFSIL